jgi:hypothetical protein
MQHSIFISLIFISLIFAIGVGVPAFRTCSKYQGQDNCFCHSTFAFGSAEEGNLAKEERELSFGSLLGTRSFSSFIACNCSRGRERCPRLPLLPACAVTWGAALLFFFFFLNCSASDI